MLALDQVNLTDRIRPPQTSPVADLVKELLVLAGEDPEREGLKRTPERVARMLNELLAGYQVDPEAVINDALFESDYNGIVLVRDIQFFSLCEHHLLPVYGQAHVAYIPDGKILGLSKIPRTVEMFARRLQLQERLTQQIAEFLEEVLQPKGVAVVLEAAHMCAMMRGVNKAGTHMVTQAMRGICQSDVDVRREVLSLLTLSREQPSD